MAETGTVTLLERTLLFQLVGQKTPLVPRAHPPEQQMNKITNAPMFLSARKGITALKTATVKNTKRARRRRNQKTKTKTVTVGK